LVANPRTSRGRSIEPAPPATVENRTNTGVRTLGYCRNAAREYVRAMSYGANEPCAAEPRAWTTRSGIRS
jgi:hypothetical protein